jgi:hypothetical protein
MAVFQVISFPSGYPNKTLDAFPGSVASVGAASLIFVLIIVMLFDEEIA